MKTVVYLGILMFLAITAQVLIEKQSPIRIDSTESDTDSIMSRYKFDGGKFYFLENNSQWVEKTEFLWRGTDGILYRIDNKVVYRSDNGKLWTVAFHLDPKETNSEHWSKSGIQTAQ